VQRQLVVVPPQEFIGQQPGNYKKNFKKVCCSPVLLRVSAWALTHTRANIMLLPTMPTVPAQTVCTYWLRGMCMKGDACGFLHQYDVDKMPICRNLLKFGQCKELDCPYKHNTGGLGRGSFPRLDKKTMED
jgi:hypothetical protein